MDDWLLEVAEPDDAEKGQDGPELLGDILAELLARYEARFPEAKITIVETPAAA